MNSYRNSRGLSDAQIEDLRDNASDVWRAMRVVLPAVWFFALIILGATLGYSPTRCFEIEATSGGVGKGCQADRVVLISSDEGADDE